MRYLKVTVLVVAAMLALVVGIVQAEETNRNEKRSELAEGGWEVVYGDLINEADYAAFIAAVAAAVACECPVPIDAWFEGQIDAQVAKMQKSAADVGEDFLIKLIIDSLNDGGRTMRTGNLEVSAGLVTYKRWETVIYHEPRTYKCKQDLPFGGWTWSICTTQEKVEREIPLPNNFQPYLRFRVAGSEGTGAASGTGSATGEGWQICNKSSDPKVWVAYAYHDGSEWIRAGWRGIEKGDCSQILESVNTRYVFYYAESDTGSWGGDVELCIHPTKQFRIGDGETCSSPNELAGFKRVDTGESRNWTNNLVD